MVLRSVLVAVALCLGACPSAPSAPAVPSSAATSEVPTPRASILSARAEDARAVAGAQDAGALEPAIDPADVLFPDAATTPPGAAGCKSIHDATDRVRCLFTTRYERDPEAASLALSLYERTGSVAGVQVEQDMDGGFRGLLHLVPEVPIGRHRRHLAWVAEAMDDIDAVVAKLRPRAPVRYRVKPLAFRFFRSVDRTTPSAYAEGWTVSYNVSGSLLRSADGVRETLFHEIFHLNDAAHDDWSRRTLQGLFDAIVARCGTRVACLRPYAPSDTLVRGGTYYAFQPDNGASVHEYAAELALRWYREERAVARRDPLGRPPFKCGPEENRRAWDALVAEFFGGADDVPACAGARPPRERTKGPL